MVELVKEGIGQCRVVDESTRQGFHADEAHVMLEAGLHNLLVFFRREIGERILQRVIAVALNGFHGHILTVVADANKPDLALAFGNLHGIIQAFLVTWAGAIIGIMELI